MRKAAGFTIHEMSAMPWDEFILELNIARELNRTGTED